MYYGNEVSFASQRFKYPVQNVSSLKELKCTMTDSYLIFKNQFKKFYNIYN